MDRAARGDRLPGAVDHAGDRIETNGAGGRLDRPRLGSRSRSRRRRRASRRRRGAGHGRAPAAVDAGRPSGPQGPGRRIDLGQRTDGLAVPGADARPRRAALRRAWPGRARTGCPRWDGTRPARRRFRHRTRPDAAVGGSSDPSVTSRNFPPTNTVPPTCSTAQPSASQRATVREVPSSPDPTRSAGSNRSRHRPVPTRSRGWRSPPGSGPPGIRAVVYPPFPHGTYRPPALSPGRTTHLDGRFDALRERRGRPADPGATGRRSTSPVDGDR